MIERGEAVSHDQFLNPQAISLTATAKTFLLHSQDEYLAESHISR